MRFILNVALDNDSMRDPESPDEPDRYAIAEVLNRVANQVKDFALDARTILDDNGNPIGRYEITERDA